MYLAVLPEKIAIAQLSLLLGTYGGTQQTGVSGLASGRAAVAGTGARAAVGTSTSSATIEAGVRRDE